MMFPNSSLAFLMVLSAIASTAFVDIVDGAPASDKSKKIESYYGYYGSKSGGFKSYYSSYYNSKSSKASKSIKNASKSAKNGKSSKKTKDNSADDVKEVKFELEFEKQLIFAPPSPSTIPIEFGSDADDGDRVLRSSEPNYFEELLMAHFTNNSKFIENLDDIKNRRNLESVLQDDLSGSSFILSEKATLIEDDVRKEEGFSVLSCLVQDGEVKNQNIQMLRASKLACTLNLCILDGQKVSDNCFNMILVDAEKNIYAIVAGTGDYFGALGQGKLVKVQGKVFNTFTVKYKPLNLADSIDASIYQF